MMFDNSQVFKIINYHIVYTAVFSCSINDINELPELGLYLNDLNQHGLSKEMVLAGWHHNSK